MNFSLCDLEFLHYSWKAAHKAGSFAASFEKKLHEKLLATKAPAEECALVTDDLEDVCVYLTLHIKFYFLLLCNGKLFVFKTTKEESPPTWEERLKLAMTHYSPEEAEKAFNKAFAEALPQTAAELRALWVTYVAELNPNDSEAYRSAYKKMSSIRPTSYVIRF